MKRAQSLAAAAAAVARFDFGIAAAAAVGYERAAVLEPGLEYALAAPGALTAPAAVVEAAEARYAPLQRIVLTHSYAL